MAQHDHYALKKCGSRDLHLKNRCILLRDLLLSVPLIHVDVHVHDPHLAPGPNVYLPASFFGGAEDNSLLPLYAHHVWEREVS